MEQYDESDFGDNVTAFRQSDLNHQNSSRVEANKSNFKIKISKKQVIAFGCLLFIVFGAYYFSHTSSNVEFANFTNFFSSQKTKLEPWEIKQNALQLQLEELQNVLVHQKESNDSLRNTLLLVQNDVGALSQGLLLQRDELLKLRSDFVDKTMELDRSLNATNQLVSDMSLTFQNFKAESETKNANQDRVSVSKYKAELSSLKKEVSALAKKIQTVKTAQPLKPKSDSASDEPRVAIDNSSNYKLIGAAKHVAIVKSTVSGSQVRVSKGKEILGCGIVESIDVLNRQVKTTLCLIK